MHACDIHVSCVPLLKHSKTEKHVAAVGYATKVRTKKDQKEQKIGHAGTKKKVDIHITEIKPLVLKALDILNKESECSFHDGAKTTI